MQTLSKFRGLRSEVSKARSHGAAGWDVHPTSKT